MAWTPLGNRANAEERRMRRLPTMNTTTSPTMKTASCQSAKPEVTGGLAGSQREDPGRHTPTSGDPEVCAATVPTPGRAGPMVVEPTRWGTTTRRAMAKMPTDMTRRSQRLTGRGYRSRSAMGPRLDGSELLARYTVRHITTCGPISGSSQASPWVTKPPRR